MSDTELLFEPDSFAIVEVMGHNTFAGKVSQHVLGGTAFIRVDVPELPERVHTQYGTDYRYPAVPAFTKLIGASSIYAITPCTEAAALKVAASKRASPMEVVNVSPIASRRAIAAANTDETDDEVPY